MNSAWDGDKGGRDQWIAWLTEILTECYRVLKPGAMALVWAIPRTSHWTATAVENSGFQIRDIIMHIFGSGFPKSHDISKAIDKKAGAEREVVGKKYNKSRAEGNIACKGLNTKSKYDPITAPSTDQAKLWNGWGTALKPAAEHWIVAMKPLDGTFANNALKHGVAGLNIAGSRIGINPDDDIIAKNPNTKNKGENKVFGKYDGVEEKYDYSKGRFPANVILDEEAGKMLDEMSGELKSGKLTAKQQINGGFKGAKNCYGTADKGGELNFAQNKGGASRFFYCAKSSKHDRGEGNIHPTCKPTKLMQYLVRLTKTPTGGVVLDPFGGSCTTAVACIRENRDFIMIEMDKEYCKIGEARIAHALKEKEAEPNTLNI